MLNDDPAFSYEKELIINTGTVNTNPETGCAENKS
jgi:hypothetical protein